MFDEVYISVHLNIILKHNGLSSAERNESDFVFSFSGVCVCLCACVGMGMHACVSVKGCFETELQEYN